EFVRLVAVGGLAAVGDEAPVGRVARVAIEAGVVLGERADGAAGRGDHVEILVGRPRLGAALLADAAEAQLAAVGRPREAGVAQAKRGRVVLAGGRVGDRSGLHAADPQTHPHTDPAAG